MQTLWKRILDIFVLSFVRQVKSNQLMVPNELLPHVLQATGGISRVVVLAITVIVQATLVSNLMSNELSMMPGCYALVDQLCLVRLMHQISRDELCHLHVVSENVNR